MADTKNTDPLLALLEDAEWSSPQGRPVKTSPYLGIVQKSQADGKPYAINITLNGKTADEQFKDLGKHVQQFRKAGSQMEPPVTVLVQAGEVDLKTGNVKVTFMTRDKITRARKEQTAEATVTESAK